LIEYAEKTPDTRGKVLFASSPRRNRGHPMRSNTLSAVSAVKTGGQQAVFYTFAKPSYPV